MEEMTKIEQEFMGFYVETYNEHRHDLQKKVMKLTLSSADQHRAVRDYGLLGNMDSWKYMVDKFMEQFKFVETPEFKELMIPKESIIESIHIKLNSYGTSYRQGEQSEFEKYVHYKHCLVHGIKSSNDMLVLMLKGSETEYGEKTRAVAVKEMVDHIEKNEKELANY